MKIYPAIDIQGGRCVRLKQGDFDQVTVFNDTPWQVAREWEEAGASFIHVVDLDGARSGSGCNNEAIREIVSRVKIPVQVGGGIRNIQHVEEKLAIGVSRVILGTAAVKNPDFVKQAVEAYGAQIAVGVDAKNGMVAVSGWEEVSRVSALHLCLDMQALGVSTIIYTDIAKDGMMQGPNLEETQKIIQNSSMDIIASGGVSTLADLDRLNEIGAAGVIIGKALFIKAVNLAEAIKTYERV